MFHRQKVYIGLAVAAGLCSTVGLLIYLRNRRQKSSKKKVCPVNDRRETFYFLFFSWKRKLETNDFFIRQFGCRKRKKFVDRKENLFLENFLGVF